MWSQGSHASGIEKQVLCWALVRVLYEYDGGTGADAVDDQDILEGGGLFFLLAYVVDIFVHRKRPRSAGCILACTSTRPSRCIVG